MSSFIGRTALVTYGSRGIGEAVCKRFAAEGAIVAVHYSRNSKAAEEVVESIVTAGGSAFTIQADFEAENCAETLWSAFDERIKALTGDGGVDIGDGGVDILVKNYDTVVYEAIEDTTRDSFDRLLTVNVRAPFFVLQQGLERMRDGGRIINISSPSHMAAPSHAIIKGSIDAFTLSMAGVLRKRRITVNSLTVAPEVNGSRVAGQLAAETAGISVLSPDKIATPEQVAETLFFFASEDGQSVTGTIFDPI